MNGTRSGLQSRSPGQVLLDSAIGSRCVSQSLSKPSGGRAPSPLGSATRPQETCGGRFCARSHWNVRMQIPRVKLCP
ncbi:hypothetical protein BD413DRAFT_568953 [Trametes elegans]|nr:hypothetical protein BD413DRAFT_568953 [Trametes elegans]